MVVDADPGAHQAVLAGFLAGRSADGKGLLRIAEAHRDRRSLKDVVVDQSIPLAEEDQHSRRFLPGFVRPGAASLFSGVWSDLMAVLAQLGDSGVDVIIDVGRLGPQGLPTPVVEIAQLVGVVLRSNLRSVVSAQVNLLALRDQTSSRSDHGPVGLVVVGPGQPYATGEIAKALDLPCLTTVADDAAAAAHLSDGRPRPRKFEHSALLRSLHTAAGELAARVDKSAAALARG